MPLQRQDAVFHGPRACGAACGEMWRVESETGFSDSDDPTSEANKTKWLV